MMLDEPSKNDTLLALLWRQRDEPDFGSKTWCRTWAKRLLLTPQLMGQLALQRKLKKAGASIHPTAYLADMNSYHGRPSLISVGSESFIGKIHAALHDKILIGSRVCINDGVKLLTASHDVCNPTWPTVTAPITINDYAWIATNAILLPGVTIGRGAVVGAAAVVTRDVPPSSVVAGNPAKTLPITRNDSLDYSPVSRIALFAAWKSVAAANSKPAAHSEVPQ